MALEINLLKIPTDVFLFPPFEYFVLNVVVDFSPIQGFIGQFQSTISIMDLNLQFHEKLKVKNEREKEKDLMVYKGVQWRSKGIG